MIGLEVGGLGGLFAIIALIMVVPAILLFIIGAGISKSNKKRGKIFYILAVVYLVISFGSCGLMMA